MLLTFLCALAAASELTILGWSPDEQYVALRSIDGIATGPVTVGREACLQRYGSVPRLELDAELPKDAVLRCTKEVVYCTGYVDPVSKKPFGGDLQISVYKLEPLANDQGFQLSAALVAPSMTIYEAGVLDGDHIEQDYDEESELDRCTTHSEASKRLQQVKQLMKQHRIDLQQPGSSVDFSKPIAAPSAGLQQTIYRLTGLQPQPRDSELLMNDSDRLEVMISHRAYHIGDGTGASMRLLGWTQLLANEHHEEADLSADPFPHYLLATAPLSVDYTMFFAGSASVQLQAVWSSPSKRILLFAQSEGNFEYHGGHHYSHSIPFAVQRWKLKESEK